MNRKYFVSAADSQSVEPGVSVFSPTYWKYKLSDLPQNHWRQNSVIFLNEPSIGSDLQLGLKTIDLGSEKQLDFKVD